MTNLNSGVGVGVKGEGLPNNIPGNLRRIDAEVLRAQKVSFKIRSHWKKM